MVSIPDWSKFARLQDAGNNQTQSTQSKYYKQREYDAIRQAEKHGYFFKPDVDFLLERFGESVRSVDIRDIHYIRYVQLDGVHLRHLGDISVCMRLRICDLSNNYITRFDALGTCRQLIKLDLHGNQIAFVPSIAFWSGLKHLKILYLHDNPIGRIENIHYLGATRRLSLLTLHDTPLSLKKNYRHHVVNSIWSLKALDNFVISDEEIIEESAFGGRFSTMHPAFYINLSPAIPKDSTYVEHLTIIQHLISEINLIMARHSPVLIIQRYIRGYLTRKRYKLVQDTRVWAAIIIQRKWRDYKGLPQLTARSERIPPPPSSSPVNCEGEPKILKNEPENLTLDSPLAEETVRPSSTPALSEKQLQGDGEPRPTPELGYVRSAGSKPSSRYKSLHINLSKLQTSTLQTLQNDAQVFESQMSERPDALPAIAYLTPRRQRKETKPILHDKTATSKCQDKIIQRTKQSFAPVISASSTPPETRMKFALYESVEQTEIPETQFRLRGYKPIIYRIDPLAELIISRQEVANDIRDAEDEHHRRQQMIPKPRIIPRKAKNNGDRFFAKTQGTMGFSCLQAVQNAYKERARAERTAIKMERIMNRRDDRDAAKQRIKIYQEEKRQNILKQRRRENARVVELLEQREVRRLHDVDRAHEIRNKVKEMAKNLLNEYTFVSDFCTQHTSVSNALTRHDRQVRREDSLNDNNDRVQANRDIEMEQQDVINRYLEHRQLTRQAESAVAREALETKILKDANDRMMQAHARVEQLRSLRKKAREMCPLPPESRLSYPAEELGPPISSRLGKHPQQSTFIQ
ncbi:uncharacterized protein LOC141914513 [Tubulanus polymorphus]|uniref:uncharacterized protein LOC141914513 n=1 Tax=Tubulanus polymorphus TaxID=672921 RepID=UPI003DA346B1